MGDRSERLAIIITAQDLASGKLGKVRGELAAMGTSGKIASVGIGAGMLAVNKGEQALGNFKNRLTSLAAPLAMIGLTGGLFSLGGALTAGIHKAADFGESVDKAMAITGLGVEKASALASALAYVGVDADATVKMLGMAEKNLGALTLTTKKATDFQKTYGLSLTDSNGKAVDANELLLRSADYFNNKQIPAATKAAALAKVYGRAWTSNIEVFELGRKKLADAEQTAKDLGLTMTKDNVGSFEKFRDSSREASTAVSGLELQLGLLVMPDIADAMKSFAEYVRTHQADIHKFFADGLSTAKAFGGFITGTVIPAISSIAGAVSGIWGSIPGPMKDLLVKGFVADRTMKFFFGMSPIHAVVSLAEGAIAKGFGSIVGGIFTRGGSPATPMFVADVSGGLGGKGGPAVPGGGPGLVGFGAAAGIIAAGAITSWIAANGLRDQRNAIASAGGLNNTQALAVQLSQMDPANRQLALMHGAQAEFARAGTTYAKALAEATGAVQKFGTATTIVGSDWSKGKGLLAPPASGLSGRLTHAMGGKIGSGEADMAGSLTSAFIQSVSPSQKSMASAMDRLATLQGRYLSQGDTKLAASIGADIRLLGGVIARNKPAVTVNVANTISIRDMALKSGTYSTYGVSRAIGKGGDAGFNDRTKL